MTAGLIPIIYIRNGAGEMFADIKISVSELEPLLAQAISQKLKTPITAESVLAIDYELDDDGDFTGLTVEVELPSESDTNPPDEPQ